jgi:diacylglycerol kinase family enzyme
LNHLFVINPRSFKQGNADKVIEEIKSCFEPGRESDYGIYMSRYARDAEIAIQKHIESLPEKTSLRVYAVGGDGILFDCLNGIVGFPDAELTNIPHGRANDFIRAFGVEAKKSFLDIKSLINAPSIFVDIINYGSGYGINQMSLGLEGQATNNATVYLRQNKTKFIKHFLGSIYTLFGFLTMFNQSILQQKYKITLDGEDYSGNYFNISVTNTPCKGGNLVTNTYSVPTDGLLNIMFARSANTFKVINAIRDYTKGNFEKQKELFFHKTFKNMDITSELPLRVQIDGEAFYTDKLTVDIIPDGVRFIVPEGIGFADYSNKGKGKPK